MALYFYPHLHNQQLILRKILIIFGTRPEAIKIPPCCKAI